MGTAYCFKSSSFSGKNLLGSLSKKLNLSSAGLVIMAAFTKMDSKCIDAAPVTAVAINWRRVIFIASIVVRINIKLYRRTEKAGWGQGCHGIKLFLLAHASKRMAWHMRNHP
jgi:hypothetical protein